VSITTALLLAWLHACSLQYGVEPAFSRAVMEVESGLPGVAAYRVGPLGTRGTYIGPMGIHKQFRKKWDIDNPYENIRVGVAALQGDKMRVLRRYNTSCNGAYVKAVMAKYRKYKNTEWGCVPLRGLGVKP
jgi:hypothetical protein